MIELRVNLDSRLLDGLSASLFEAGAEGVMEQDDEHGTWLVVYCESAAQVAELEAAITTFRHRAGEALPDAEIGPVQTRLLDSSWQQNWLSALGPAPLTGGLVLRPTHAAPPPPGEETLWFEPAACFGAGDHPTTRLAAAAVARECVQRSNAAPGTKLEVLDVGSGSGVLCFVALRRGASRALGLDIADEAVRAAHRNAELNGFDGQCMFATTPVEEVTERYAVVVANIDALTLQRLGPALLERVLPGGVLLLTGVLDEQEAALTTALRGLGAEPPAREQEGDWVLLSVLR